jgi:CRISPR system Cascade subunit CasC
MAEFIQLHMLVSYPPSNLNRDDLGRPKTAVMGGTQRLRISSQSLKRAWRTSDIFTERLKDHMGTRTKEMGVKVKNALTTGLSLKELLDGKTIDDPKKVTGIPEEKAKVWAGKIASVFVDKPTKETNKNANKSEAEKPVGETKAKKEKESNIDQESLKSEQLVFYSNEEIAAIQTLITTLIKDKREPKRDELSSLLKEDLSSVDVAMFGRMLANAPSRFNVEAAVQVAHAVTVHEVAVEDDYFTAVDDLNKEEDDAGAAHLGETEFASGLFYEYVCINKTLLEKTLDQKKDKDGNDLANIAIRALVESAAKIAPSGKQNSFASRAYASFLLVEKGDKQPRSLSVAYLTAIKDSTDLLGSAISCLKETREKMNKVYGPCSRDEKEMNAHSVPTEQKDIITLEQILKFVAS